MTSKGMFTYDYLMWAINMYNINQRTETMSSTITYYQTRRNADTTEGRGPMVNDRAFVHYKDAAAYIDEQPGVQGRRQEWSKAKYGDWDIQTVEAHTGPFDINADKREKALAKLSPEDRKLLGLE